MTPTLLLLLLGAFVAGVFVGAGQWFALFVFVAALAMWRWLEPPPSDLPLSTPKPRPGQPPGRFRS